MTRKWYETLCLPKMHPHTKYGIPTSKNIGDMHRTRSGTDWRTVQLLYASQSSFGGIKIVVGWWLFENKNKNLYITYFILYLHKIIEWSSQIKMIHTYDNFTLNSIFRPKAFNKKKMHFSINYIVSVPPFWIFHVHVFFLRPEVHVFSW